MDKIELLLDRNMLYEELWNNSMLSLSKKYQIEYNLFRRIIRELKIPYPGSGYWTKIKFNKDVVKPDLPTIDNDLLKRLNDFNAIIKLDSLRSKSKKDNPDQTKLHLESPLVIITKELMQKKEIVEKWLLHNLAVNFNNMNSRIYKDFLKTASLDFELKDTVSPNNFIRSIKLIDTLVVSLKDHDGKFLSGTLLYVDGEQVSYSIRENHLKSEHVITNNESKLLSEYEKERITSRYCSKPRIPKLDEFFNNQLSISINGKKFLSDTKHFILENRVNEIANEFIKQSELIRIIRLKVERSVKVREQRSRRLSNFQATYRNEVSKIVELENIIDDFEFSIILRNLIKRVEANSSKNANVDWISWAKEKADWYDPTIQKRDSIIGKRLYENSKSEKLQTVGEIFTILESIRNNGSFED
jgi:hypothetical protein